MCINPQDAIYYSPVLCELRVLKICSLSLSLRRTVKIYWQSLVKMRDLLLYILFTMFVVAVLCVQMYQGLLTQRCVKEPKNGEVWSSFTGNPGELRIALQCFRSLLLFLLLLLVCFVVSSLQLVSSNFVSITFRCRRRVLFLCHLVLPFCPVQC